MSKPTKPDVLLGDHPAAIIASQKQSIAIWHGQRIERHLADWINKVTNWSAKVRERITLSGRVYEIDNLAWNPRLNVVLAVEAKRVWANQNAANKEIVKSRNKRYMDPSNSAAIAASVGQRSSDFRYFVFDVYGTTASGNNGLPTIAGDKIANVFNPPFAAYVEWERQVIANTIFERLDQSWCDDKREELLRTQILRGSLAEYVNSSVNVLSYIDRHAR